MKKLSSKRGFTLVEMLISVMLLGFVTLLVTVMTSVILNSTVTMREVAQAEILGSEALDNLQGKLRVAENVSVTTAESGATVKFDLDSSNTGYTFGVEEGRIVIGKVPEEGETFKGNPLFAGVSYGNLRVTSLQFSGNGEKKTVEVRVEISFGGKPLRNGRVTVKPLNGITVS